MIVEDGECIITFTFDEIRDALHRDLSDDECEGIAYTIELRFDDEFSRVLRDYDNNE